MTEDMILTEIDLHEVLKKLPDVDRELLILFFRIAKPEDWTSSWPPKISHIGKYIGVKYEGKPLSEAAVRYRKKVAIESLRGERPPLKKRVRPDE